MARYYRKRYTRVVKPKRKWATNMRKIFFDSGTISVPHVGIAVLLCANSAEVVTGEAQVPTPTVIKTGNYKVQCDAHIGTSSSAVIRTMMYIVYIPEGVFVPSTASTVSSRVQTDFVSLNLIIQRHPEWILAWRQFGADVIAASANLDKVSFSSRLKRNLNSGDKIYAVFLANDDTEGTGTNVISRAVVNGTCQFWTCNN